ncbi:MAG: hypothetical protein J1F33_01510 [Clostridiales bacterium]|nr:hypothetical protein [Clostridiales bacterium]
MNDRELTELKNRARQGDADAQYELGLFYDGADNYDETEAFGLFLLAAERGDNDAQLKVAELTKLL